MVQYHLISPWVTDNIDVDIPTSRTLSATFVNKYRCFCFVTAFSLITNLVLGGIFMKQSVHYGQYASDFGEAELSFDMPRPIERNVPGSEAAEEILWRIESNYDRGMVALSDDFVEQAQLPRSQRFPWDDSKGLYLINGYHNLHCIRILHFSLKEFHNELPQSRGWSHVTHCLHVLRDDIICNADDRPRYTGGDQPSMSSGLGQSRMCRSWKKLEAWADKHNACFKDIDPTNRSIDNLDRFRFCPPGSPYEIPATTQWLQASE